MYHIASTFIGPSTMETSMEQAMDGGLFYFRGGPAALGLATHMAVGAVFGGIFGVLARALRLRGGIAVAWGIASYRGHRGRLGPSRRGGSLRCTGSALMGRFGEATADRRRVHPRPGQDRRAEGSGVRVVRHYVQPPDVHGMRTRGVL